MSVDIQPFTIDIPAEEVERMKRKLRDTRIPQNEIVPGAGDDYGLPETASPLSSSVHPPH